VRVLFSCVAGHGHFHPLVPLARAFADEGHEVAFATSASFAERVRAAGFEVLPAGMNGAELDARFAGFRRHLLTLPVPDRRPLAFTRRFGTLEAPAKLGALREVVTTWGPELLIHESADLAAPIVATALGLPSVHHAFGRLVPPACFERAATETAPLWMELGLEPDLLCGVYRGAYVDLCPPSFQSDTVPPRTRVELVRPLFPAARAEASPPWLDALPERPTVYVTLGTVHNDIGVFRLVLDALAGLDCNVVVTIGRDNDPGALAPVPANAVVERYVAQSFVLPHASVVVGHGGSGSTLAAFAHGLPQLLLPQGADQFDNAARCSELGAGLVLMPDELTAEAVRARVETLLSDPSYGTRARALAAEIAEMPHPREVASRLVATQAVW
jgi:UDP:flavonoid glycosyltransferase YjiC (YdhE family)